MKLLTEILRDETTFRPLDVARAYKEISEKMYCVLPNSVRREIKDIRKPAILAAIIYVALS